MYASITLSRPIHQREERQGDGEGKRERDRKREGRRDECEEGGRRKVRESWSEE